MIMARSRDDRKTDASKPLRLRVPAALAVALLGASATVAMSIGGCEETIREPADAGQLSKERIDAEVDDGGIAGDGRELDDDDDDDPPRDAGLPPPDAPET